MAGAKTVSLDGEQASIDIPDTWTSKAQPADATSSATSLILSAVNAEKTSMLQILVCNNPRGMLASQPDLITNIKDNISNQVLSHGGQVQFTGEGKVNLNDVPAYLIQYTATGTSSPQLTARSYQIAANGKLYVISLRTVNAAADADLQAIANSFHFDSPPVLPTPQVPVHRIRYYLIAAAAVVVLVALGVGLYYYRQRQLYE
jgi:hypothetical protein